MAIWNVDLTTEDGALNAAQLGGLACFIGATLAFFGAMMILGLGAGSGELRAALFDASAMLVEIVLFVVAGVRLRAGKGSVWGSVAAMALVIELAIKLLTFAIVGVLLDTILLIGVINGLRGIRALGRIDLRPADAAEIFN
ncbi:hypothetical protein [Sphingomonas mali]|uniref:hypothetical protein n=1 Tax=Sphingomonas mali TaxID=40682 RepID=UPI000836D309|nr:hypothetical protein [Sphingomonas mali]